MATLYENGIAAVNTADEFITSDFLTTGTMYWVDSVTGSDGNSGAAHLPFATLGAAISAATANNGDIIVIKSGHSQTLSSAINVNKSGLKIYGLGAGTAAPQFILAANIDGITVTESNNEINNLYFPIGTTTSNAAKINIAAGGVTIRGCTFKQGQYDLNGITITTDGAYAHVDSCTFSVMANGPDTGVTIEGSGATEVTIEDCSFDGGSAANNYDDAAVYSTVAHLNYVFKRITLTNGARIRNTSGSSKGFCSGVIAGDASSVQI